MGQRIGGVLNMTIGGVQYPLRGNWEVSPSSVKREGIAGQDGVHGYTEMPIVPGAKGDISTLPGLSLKDLEAVVDETAQLTLANGTTYVLSQAWTMAAFSIGTSEGKFGLELGCVSCDEI